MLIEFKSVFDFFICIGTIAVAYFAYVQLGALKRTQNAQFIQNLTKDIYSEKAIAIISLLHIDCIDFNNNNNIPYFTVNVEKLEQIFPVTSLSEKTLYTSYEFDTIILNYLDAVGMLESQKVIDYGSAHQYFGWYITTVMENKAILEYLNWIRDFEKNPFVFEKLQSIYTKFVLSKIYL